MDISREHIQIGKYFSKGGEAYTIEELGYKLLIDLGVDKIESDRIICEAVEKRMDIRSYKRHIH